jgi:putative nucleotidyltransferase with HDIG domain
MTTGTTTSKTPSAPNQRALDRMRADGTLRSLVIACVFALACFLLLSQRTQVPPWSVGQFVPHDIVSRVDFVHFNAHRYAEAQRQRREQTPHVFRETTDQWAQLEERLLGLPDRLAGNTLDQLTPPLRDLLDGATLARLQEYATQPNRGAWEQHVRGYIHDVQALNLVIIPDDQRRSEIDRSIQLPRLGAVKTETTFSPAMQDELAAKLRTPAENNFPLALYPRIVQFTLRTLTPTHELDEQETASAQNLAAERVPREEGMERFYENARLVSKGEISQEDWSLLRAEHEAFLATLGGGWRRQLGLLLLVGALTGLLGAYVAVFQPRVVRNHLRALAIAVLMLATLLTAQLAGLGNRHVLFFGVAPTVLVAMILAIAYDRRFAMGVATIHAILATIAMDESVSFFLVLFGGVLTCCFLLDQVRTRSKLVEVGGATAVALMVGTVAVGLMESDPARYLLRNAFYAGAAGLTVGFVVLGVLPFIEKLFRITTSMTLLELGDVSHPLLRRLKNEANGTYNHSHQVATIVEAAAEAVGANALLCRVAAYYHDVGKLRKPEYFAENQVGGPSPHLTLNPTVSLSIIIDHVKHGLELARQYNLPNSILPFIAQHHGTMVVEPFWHQAAVNNNAADPEMIDKSGYRYSGPKPRSREIALLMLADCCESATRTLPGRDLATITETVDRLIRARVEDGQFLECDLTLRDLDVAREAIIRSIMGIHHGRVPYPRRDEPAQPANVQARTA